MKKTKSKCSSQLERVWGGNRPFNEKLMRETLNMVATEKEESQSAYQPFGLLVTSQQQGVVLHWTEYYNTITEYCVLFTVHSSSIKNYAIGVHALSIIIIIKVLSEIEGM